MARPASRIAPSVSACWTGSSPPARSPTGRRDWRTRKAGGLRCRRRRSRPPIHRRKPTATCPRSIAVTARTSLWSATPSSSTTRCRRSVRHRTSASTPRRCCSSSGSPGRNWQSVRRPGRSPDPPAPGRLARRTTFREGGRLHPYGARHACRPGTPTQASMGAALLLLFPRPMRAILAVAFLTLAGASCVHAAPANSVVPVDTGDCPQAHFGKPALLAFGRDLLVSIVGDRCGQVAVVDGRTGSVRRRLESPAANFLRREGDPPFGSAIALWRHRVLVGAPDERVV